MYLAACLWPSPPPHSLPSLFLLNLTCLLFLFLLPLQLEGSISSKDKQLRQQGEEIINLKVPPTDAGCHAHVGLRIGLAPGRAARGRGWAWPSSSPVDPQAP